MVISTYLVERGGVFDVSLQTHGELQQPRPLGLHLPHVRLQQTENTVYRFTTQNLLRITFSTVCYFCAFVINMKNDFKKLNIISASCT